MLTLRLAVKNGPIPASYYVYFCLFQMLIDKSVNGCAWDSNPGRQDGRRRQIH